jgi:uncharacterized protein (DUF1330 family)
MLDNKAARLCPKESSSMATLIAEYKVADFAKFREVFDEFQPSRAAHGATGHRLLQAANDPNVVNVVIEFPTTEAAQAFAGDPARSEALARAGVIERADEVMHEVDSRSY